MTKKRDLSFCCKKGLFKSIPNFLSANRLTLSLINVLFFGLVVTRIYNFQIPNNFDPQGSCAGLCGNPYDSSLPCQCNTACESHGDCCSDYSSVCGELDSVYGSSN